MKFVNECLIRKNAQGVDLIVMQIIKVRTADTAALYMSRRNFPLAAAAFFNLIRC